MNKEKKPSTWQLLQVIRPYFSRYKHLLAIDLIFAGLTTVSEMTLPLIMRKLTNYGLYDLASLTQSVIFRLAALFVVLKLIEIIGGYFMTSMGHIMGAKIETDMRSDMFHHLQALPTAYYNEAKVGQLMTRLTNDLFDITEFAHHSPEEYFIGLLKMIVALIVLGRIHLPMALILFLLIPFMFMTTAYFRNKMREAQLDQRKQIGGLNSDIEDSLLGIRVVKSFANEQIEIDKFEVGNQNFLNIKRDFYKAMASFNSITKIFDGFMYLVVLIGGGFLLMQQQMTAGDLLVFVMYVNTLLESVRRIVQYTEQFQKGMTGVERFNEVMETKSDLYDSPTAHVLTNVRGDIHLEDVSFIYPNSELSVLKALNLEIAAGSKVALVGASGAGKSTIGHIIPRFYDVSSGRVTVDGYDVRDLTLKSLRDSIGIVQQDVYLFAGTIADNIAYGKPGASREEVYQAAKLAGALEFIEAMPEGFDTYVGERGVMLSGGQQQRISIARVFLKNPPILILDEATSALDNQSERLVQASLEKLTKGRTTITIAHRLTTIEDSDCIYVLDEGEVLERGNHEELMQQKGIYYHLYTRI